ncbi:ATP-dependent DNA helicase [Candidatus Fermentibacteria bacterium]|nr:ATP-dependent DNA helicase [Candidatus Fermentibacteria bacterium]
MKLHRAFQQSESSSGRALSEVAAELESFFDGVRIRVRGRADLVRTSRDGRAEKVLEIKTISSPPGTSAEILEKYPDHALQAWFYARALGGGERALPVSLAYIHPEGRSCSCFELPLDGLSADLDRRLDGLLRSAASYARSEYERLARTAALISALGLPHPEPRPGQSGMMELSSDVVRQGGRCLIEAPPGTGKTAAVLAGALPQALSGMLTVFYLTSRNTQKTTVAKTLDAFLASAPELHCMLLESRERMCPAWEDGCRECPLASGSAWLDPLEPPPPGVLDSGRISLLAASAGVCPFEMALALSTRCDVVVCDANHVFDPGAFIRRFFAEPSAASRCVLLVDEAADLPARSRAFFSPSVCRTAVERLYRRPPGDPRTVRRAVRPFLKAFREVEASIEGTCPVELPAEMAPAVRADAWMDAWATVSGARGLFEDMARTAVEFERAERQASAGGRMHLLGSRPPSGCTLEWLCTDSSRWLSKRFESVHSAICFSATLSPLEHFRMELGLPGETTLARFDYPFPAERLGVWVDPSVDTRLRSRSHSLDALCSRMASILSLVPGTYLAFFPSFEYLTLASSRMEAVHGARVLVQAPGMRESERGGFLAEASRGGLLVMCVAGGIFSEGIDLEAPDRRGAFVVGPCLPTLDMRSRLLLERYREDGLEGFLHACVVPGVNRVIQAAGRLTRGPGDRGILILFDGRFLESPWRGLLPGHWRHFGHLRVLDEDLSGIAAFWGMDGRGAEV